MYQIKNPIIPGFHPDPSVIHVGDDYYVANSTFEWFPGVEIHHSKDLIQWELLNHPLNTLDLLDMRGIINSGGVWAPCLSYDNGIYYLIYSIVRTFDETTQDTDNFLTTASNIQGPWSEAIYLNSGGFDPSLFHDEDGSKWFMNMRWDSRIDRNHFPGIVMQEYSENEKKLVGTPELIFKGSKLGLTEGPHMYKREGYYYLMTAEGGTSENHCITMCRSKDRKGPFEIDPQNPILTTKNRENYPIQYAGHGDIVEAEDGNWYLFHLASRKQLFHGYSVLGRETYIQNVYWNKEGWLRLADDSNLPKTTALVQQPNEQTEQKYQFFHKYNFDREELDIHFSTLRIPLNNTLMSLTERPGYLRLKGKESILSKHNQSFIGTRIVEPEFTAITSIDYHPESVQQMAGLTIYYNTANFYYLYISNDEKKGKSIQLMKRESKRTKLLLKEPIALVAEGEVLLRVDFTTEVLRFYYKMKSLVSDASQHKSMDDKTPNANDVSADDKRSSDSWHQPINEDNDGVSINTWYEIIPDNVDDTDVTDVSAEDTDIDNADVDIADTNDNADANNIADTNDNAHIDHHQEPLPVFILSDEYANICGEQGFTGSFIGLCCQDLTGRRTSADYAFLDISESESFVRNSPNKDLL